ncbi:hypothetical protein [Streptomyces sp. NPDC001635]
MRRITAIANILAATTLVTVASLTPASADSVTDIDNYFLNTWQDGYGNAGYSGPMGSRSALGSDVSKYCNWVGIVAMKEANGKCGLIDFAETKRTGYVTDYRRQISPDPYINCNPKHDVPYELAYSKTRSATNSVGTSLSVAVSVNYGVKPFGVGVEGSITTTVGVNYNYTWGESTTESSTYHVDVAPGEEGSLDWFTYHGTAHGIATVAILNNGSPNMPPTGTYKVVTDITGDLPKPDEKSDAFKAQTTANRYVPHYQRLTNAELANACSNWPKDSHGNLQQWIATGPGEYNGYYVPRPDGDQEPVPDSTPHSAS